jgi:CDP-glucose 4,6-dehydratase
MATEEHRYGGTVKGARVLITGADGLIGSWLAARLLSLGAELTVLRRDRRQESALDLACLGAEFDTLDGDLLDGELLEVETRNRGIETVIHLAAQATVGPAHRSPRATFEANVLGTWNVLEAARLNQVARVVVASSDTAYGPSTALPYTEAMALEASHPYDASKAAADIIARSYWSTYGLPVAVTRMANIYGGGDRNRSRLIPETAAAIISGRAPEIRSDGSPERDFLYVTDAVEAYLAILDLLDDGVGRGEAFNAGSGVPRKAIAIVETMCRLAGAELAVNVQGTGVPDGEISRHWIDSAKLRGLTGWEPKVGLEQGLALTLDWYREHPEVLAD